MLLLNSWMPSRTLATVDEWALERLRSLVIDVAFLGTNAICLGTDLTTPDPAVAAVKQTAVRVSTSRRVLVAARTRSSGRPASADSPRCPTFKAIVTGTELRCRRSVRRRWGRVIRA